VDRVPAATPALCSLQTGCTCSAKRTVASRAYINMRDAEDVPRLAAALDGRAFVTERGAQHRCAVEYAPCQRVPPSRVKRDPREGTMESGAHHSPLAPLDSGGAQSSSCKELCRMQCDTREHHLLCSSGPFLLQSHCSHLVSDKREFLMSVGFCNLRSAVASLPNRQRARAQTRSTSPLWTSCRRSRARGPAPRRGGRGRR